MASITRVMIDTAVLREEIIIVDGYILLNGGGIYYESKIKAATEMLVVACSIYRQIHEIRWMKKIK